MENELSRMSYYSMPKQQTVVKEVENNTGLLQKPERKMAKTESKENKPAMTAYVVFDALRKKRQELSNAKK